MGDTDNLVSTLGTPQGGPVPPDALVFRLDVELGPERIRATDAVMEFGPGRRADDRFDAFRIVMNRIADDVWQAMETAEWGTK